jgi:hypothetical protein
MQQIKRDSLILFGTRQNETPLLKRMIFLAWRYLIHPLKVNLFINISQ